MMLPDGDVLITGDGLTLREWTPADIGVMVELFDEQSIDDWTPLESPFDAAAAGRYLDGAVRMRREGLGIQLAITTDGITPLGEVLLFDGSGPGRAEPAPGGRVALSASSICARRAIAPGPTPSSRSPAAWLANSPAARGLTPRASSTNNAAA